MNPLLVLGIGLAVVFFGLFCLIGIIYLMSFIYRVASGENKLKKLASSSVDLKDVVPESAAPAVPALTGERRRTLIAAVSAAVAEYMGTEPSGLRIHSIKRVGAAGDIASSAGDRRELMAAISAAVAMQLDTDVSAIRIHSIRRVG